MEFYRLALKDQAKAIELLEIADNKDELVNFSVTQITLLHICALTDDAHFVRVLHRHGALFVRNAAGLTPGMVAAKNGSWNMVRVCYELGYIDNEKDDDEYIRIFVTKNVPEFLGPCIEKKLENRSFTRYLVKDLVTFLVIGVRYKSFDALSVLVDAINRHFVNQVERAEIYGNTLFEACSMAEFIPRAFKLFFDAGAHPFVRSEYAGSLTQITLFEKIFMIRIPGKLAYGGLLQIFVVVCSCVYDYISKKIYNYEIVKTEWVKCAMQAVHQGCVDAILILIALRNKIQRLTGYTSVDDLAKILHETFNNNYRNPNRARNSTAQIINILLHSGADRYIKIEGRTAYVQAHGRVNAFLADKVRFLEKHVTLFDILYTKLQVLEYEEKL